MCFVTIHISKRHNLVFNLLIFIEKKLLIKGSGGVSVVSIAFRSEWVRIVLASRSHN